MRKIIVSILSFLVSMSVVHAQDLPNYVTAADFSYECLSNKKYKVHLDVYTECGNDEGDLSTQRDLRLLLKSEKLGVENNLFIQNLGRVSEIKIFCEQRITNCNGGDDRGLQKYQFEGTLDLSAYDVSDDWIVSYQQNLRSYVLASTFVDISTESYYAEMLINNKDVSCNSSSVYNSEKGPIIRACTGEEIVYALNPSDPDGDQLTYEIQTPQLGDGVNVTYKSGFSALRPVTVSKNIEINNEGKVIVNATTVNQQGITDVKISEFRNGKLVGYVTRGLQISTFDCNNEKPIALGFNGGETKVSFCAGDTIRKSSDILLKGVDADNHNVRFRILSFERRSDGRSSRNQVIPESYSDTALLYFNWVVQPSDTGVYDLKVILEDDGCPTPRSTEETYEVKVIPLPFFDLGEDIVFKCNEDIEIDPNAEIAANPATYSWFTKSIVNQNIVETEISTETILKVDKADKYFVRITDNVGCKATDSIQVNKSLDVFFKWEQYCLGLPTTLMDSTITNTGTIVGYEWTIEGETDVVTQDTFDFTFSEAKDYDVTLKVENSVGCIEEKTEIVTICGPLEVKIGVLDSCSRSSGASGETAKFIDESDPVQGCNREIWNWEVVQNNTVIGSFSGESNEFAVYMPTAGEYDVKLMIESESGCKDSTTTQVTIVPRTELELLQSETIFQECNRADTAFYAIFDTDHLGNGPYLATEAGVERSVVITDTLKIENITETDFYSFSVTNSDGCRFSKTIIYSFPLAAGFKYDTVCALGNEMAFTNFTKSEFGVAKYEWDFGGESSSIEKDPTYAFDNSQSYNVTLKVTDVNDCSNFATHTVFNTVPNTDSITLFPNVFVQKICINDKVRAISPTFANSTRSLDSIIWDLGNGSEVYPFRNEENELVRTLADGLVRNFSFDSRDTVSIKNSIYYNYDGVNGLGNSCFKQYEISEPVIVAPEFSGTVSSNRLCVEDTAVFEFARNVNDTIPIKSWQWYFYPNRGTEIPYDSSILEIPRIYTGDELYEKGQSNNIYVRLRAEDSLGCVYDNFFELGERIIPDARASFSVSNINPGWVEIEGDCASEPLNFKFHSNFEARPKFYLFIDETSKDTLMPEDTPLDNDGVTQVGTLSHTFDHNDTLKLYFYTIERSGDGKECRSVFDTTLTLAPRPIVQATVDTVCARLPVQLDNRTTIPKGNVISYEWKIGETIYTEENPIITLPEGGLNQVVLKTVTDSNCTAYDTLNLFAQHSPIAKFSVDGDILEANTPIDFKDESVFNGSEPDSMWFDFGDGTIDIALLSNTVYATHTFDDVKVYNITHVVSNKEGCKDTVTTPTDLNTYLDIPTAFSPNGDDNNDELALIYKSIRELYEFRIYNRWGEKVFDAEGDLDKKWDGTFRDSDQPYGVYVVHIKALGAYDTEFNIKKNITLLR